MSEFQNVRVFVVEDQPQLLKNLLKSLALYPELEVIGTAQDGESGVEQMTKSLPDLVLLDLELPGIDGIEVTKRLKRSAPSIEVLVLNDNFCVRVAELISGEQAAAG